MTETSRSSAVRFVLVTIFLDSIGFGIVMPVIPRLVMELGHVSLAKATGIGGWLAAIYALLQFLCGPLMGNLGDRYGRRPVLLAAMAGLGIDYLLMAVAPRLGWLFLGRALAGIFGASFGPAQAALADISRPEERARVFGFVGAAFGTGFIVGPAIGGLLGELGPRAPFYAAAALSALNFVYGSFLFPETLPAERRRPFDLRRANPLGALISLRSIQGVLPLAAVNFFWMIAHMVYPATWAYFAIARYGWSSGMIGASLAFVGITMVLVQTLLMGRIVSAIGEWRAALLGMGIGVVSFVGYMLSTQGWMAFAIMAVTCCEAIAGPALSAMMSTRAPNDAQGELQGFNQSVGAIASILAPMLLNPALAYFTSKAAPVYFPGAAFAIAAVAGLVALLMLLRLGYRREAPTAH
ncbi:TCR/Tet family MFS transporter [Flavisphingomonas formosensis]|uniref:TCR/Tet family MFS transporter n=1 Tax=Flavisphingomonas formosensis TaxID=861534 RepID=UPI001E50E691|nr:TCR/Tet family MFS transporter [Sphingomonas formosensis]